MPWAIFGWLGLGAYLGVSSLSFSSDVGDPLAGTVGALFELLFLILVTAAGAAFIGALAVVAWTRALKPVKGR